MPYSVNERENEYCIMDDDSKEIITCYETEIEAENEMRIMMAVQDTDLSDDLIKKVIQVLFNEQKQDSYKPNQGMVSEARKGLEWRREYNRGGTAVGVARARDIISGKNLSASTVKRMFSFFSRHEVDKQGEGFSPGENGYPSAGRIAWALWGGDPGFAWSRKIAKALAEA